MIEPTGGNVDEVVDAAAKKTVARIPVGKKPYGVLYVPEPKP